MISVRFTDVVRGAACLLVCAFVSQSALAGPGDLDASFGTSGFARPTLPGTTAIHDATLQRDGKIVIVGVLESPSPSVGDRNAIVIRLHPNGSLDTSFSGDGIAVVDHGGNDYPKAVLIAADDKILIAGNRYDVFTAELDPTLARFDTDGSLDASFGQGGIASYSAFDAEIDSLVELSDGRFVAGGFSYNGTDTDFAMFAVGPNGALDTTFGTNGRQILDFSGLEHIVDMRRLPGDRIVAVGETNADGARSIGLMLVNSAGQFDTSFGPASGRLRIDGWNSVRDIELQADGKLLIAGGRIGRGFPVMGAVLRLNPDGTIDRSFGSEGRILRSDEVQQVVSDANGRIYFAGGPRDRPEPVPYGFRRYGYVEAVERDGSAARTFAGSGGTTIDAGRDHDLSDFSVRALLRQSDGRLVVVGQREGAELIVVGIAAGGQHAGILSVSRPVDASDTVSETAPGVSFLVERTGGADGTVSVSYVAESSVAVAGQDFATTSGTLTWGEGETAAKTVTVPLIDDNDFEPVHPNEPIAMRIFDPTGGAALGASTAGALVSSDEQTTQVDFLIAARGSESAGVMNAYVNRSGDARVRAVVQYSVTSEIGQAQPNIDFIPVSGTLTWEPFDMSPKLIAIPILDDGVVESEEQVRIQLSSASPGVTAYASATGTIGSDDPGAGTLTVSEGAGSVTVTFGRQGNINVAVTANVSIVNQTVGNPLGTDHGAPNVTQVSWAANETTTRTVTVPIVDDAVAEGPERFMVVIEVPGYGSNGVRVFTILDNDADVSTPSRLSFAQAEMNVAESVGTVSVTVNRSGAAAFFVGATVTVSGLDLTAPLNYPVSWGAGDSGPKTIVIPIVNDTIPEARRTLTVALKDVTGGARVGPGVSTTINVQDDDGFSNTIGFSQDEIVVSEDVDYVDLPVTTAQPIDSYGPAGPFPVSFVFRSGSTAEAGREFVLPRSRESFYLLPGGDIGFRVYLNGDNQLEDEETFTVDLVTGADSLPIARGSVTVRLTSDDSSSPGAPMQVGFVTTSITQREDQSVVNVSVRRMGAADSAVAVRYETAAGSATAGSDFVAATGQLQWTAGDMADKTIAVMLTNDTAVESTETMTLRLFAPTNGATLAEGTATISITDDESGTPPANNGGSGGGGGGSLGLSMLFALLLLGGLRVRSPRLRTAAVLRRH